MAILNSQYWSDRYKNGETGWNIGEPSTPIVDYINQLTDRSIRILVPGAGNAYEVEYLWQQGFSNVTLLDFSSEPIRNFQERNPRFPTDQLCQQDFFDHHGTYDLVLEQTFFCALDPSLRKRYAIKMNEILSPGGKLAGVLFDAPMNADRPPFGGSRSEYYGYFEPYFRFRVFDACYNSVPPRQGTELFMILEKKQSR